MMAPASVCPISKKINRLGRLIRAADTANTFMPRGVRRDARVTKRARCEGAYARPVRLFIYAR